MNRVMPVAGFPDYKKSAERHGWKLSETTGKFYTNWMYSDDKLNQKYESCIWKSWEEICHVYDYGIMLSRVPV